MAPKPRTDREPTRRSRVRRRSDWECSCTLRRSTWFVEWMADSAWIPPYPWIMERLVGVAPLVVGATVVFEAALAVMLITRWHERVALALATLWVLGLIPALAWPYWLVNVPLAIVFGILWWRCRIAK